MRLSLKLKKKIQTKTELNFFMVKCCYTCCRGIKIFSNEFMFKKKKKKRKEVYPIEGEATCVKGKNNAQSKTQERERVLFFPISAKILPSPNNV